MKNWGANKLMVGIVALLILGCCIICCVILSILVFSAGTTNTSTDQTNDSPVEENTARDQANDDPLNNAELGEVVEFSGTFEEYDSSCAFDLQCRAKVEGQWIVTNPGFVLFEELTLGKFELDPDTDLGKEVNVRAEKTLTGLTLVGSADYYIVLAE